MIRFRPKPMFAFVCALGLSSAAHAVPMYEVSFNPITAFWSNADAPAAANVSYRPTPEGTAGSIATVAWGTGGRSKYKFEATSPLPLVVTLPPFPTGGFDLGQFTHLNRVIDSGTSIKSVTLTISAGISVKELDTGLAPVDLGMKNFVFDFEHTETPNRPSSGWCANGERNWQGVNKFGCADLITVNQSSVTEYFKVGGTDFTVSIEGFRRRGDSAGTFVSMFETKETKSNKATIVGVANAKIHEVPEPGTVAMLGLGLVGVGTMLRKRRARLNS